MSDCGGRQCANGGRRLPSSPGGIEASHAASIEREGGNVNNADEPSRRWATDGMFAPWS